MCCGVARYNRLRALGVSRRELEKSVTAGHLVRPAKGVYAFPDAEPKYVTAAATSTLLTCTSAAEHYGLWMRNPSRKLHLVSTQVRSVPGTVIHRAKVLASPDMAPVVSPRECVLHSAKCLPDEAALLIAESAIVKGLVSFEDLQAAATGPGSLDMREVFEMIDSRSQSLLETLGRRIFMEAGLEVVTQARFAGVGHVDLLIEGKLVVELDGAEFHSDRTSYRQDRKRWNALTLSGYPTLRFTYEDVMFAPARMLNQVLTMLANMSH